MPDFINPYNFARLVGSSPHREPPRSQERFAGLSGRIVCEFENLTPLCIPDAEATCDVTTHGVLRKKKPFSRLPDQSKTPFIAGTSLKGMLRSVAEAASNSCLAIFDRMDEEGADPGRKRKHFAIFRDNRPGSIEERGVGRLAIVNGDLRLVDPGPRFQAELKTRGLLNQISHPHSRFALSRPDRSGLLIPSHVRKHYLDMVADEGFTLGPTPNSNEKPRRPDPRRGELQWLTEFRPGDLWFYRLDSRGQVIEIGRNFRYKWAYDPRLGAGRAFLPCHDLDNLCPCCTLFGMVRDEKSDDEVNALAGRVSIGPGRWVGGTNTPIEIDDPKILSTPKSKCRSFYLEPTGGSGNVERDEFTSFATDAVTPNPIRGRKFYWHHVTHTATGWSRLQWVDYLRRKDKGKDANGRPIRPPRTNQNAVLEALMPGAKFRFAVEFESLSSFELGLLLWTLSLPDVPDGGHHLGLGKPIGLGSVKLTIQEVVLIDRPKRYASLQETGYSKVDLAAEDRPLDVHVNAFRRGMLSRHGGADFLTLANIADLSVILSTTQPTAAAELTYPPGPQVRTDPGDPHYSELHHNWFGTKGKKWSEPLRTIQEIAEGKSQSPA